MPERGCEDADAEQDLVEPGSQTLESGSAVAVADHASNSDGGHGDAENQDVDDNSDNCCRCCFTAAAALQLLPLLLQLLLLLFVVPRLVILHNKKKIKFPPIYHCYRNRGLFLQLAS